MTQEMIYVLLSAAGLAIGWLARHYGLLGGTPPAPQPTSPLGVLGLDLLQQLQAFIANQQQHLQTTDVLKQMVNTLPAATQAPKG